MRAAHARTLLALIPLLLAPLSCTPPPQIVVLSPAHGDFVIGSVVPVSVWLKRSAQLTSFTINGFPQPLQGRIEFNVPVDPGEVFNRIDLVGTLPSGAQVKESLVVVVGNGSVTGSVADGDPSPDGVALRLNDTGLGQIAPIVESLSSGALDVSDLITSQNPIATGSQGGINYTANVVEVGFGGFGLDTDATATGVATDIQIDDFFLEIDLDLGWLGSCTLEIDAATTNITGDYDLGPLPADPSFADVNLVSSVGVSLGGFSSRFVSGICDDPLLGDIVNAIIGQGDIQQLMEQGFQDNLADPDGPGPLDSPLAAAIESALAGISIAGPVGDALGGTLDAPIASITEEAAGLTIAADATLVATSPHPDAPELVASHSIANVLPPFGALTPTGQVPYGMAFAISTSAMNQLLKVQIQNGLLRSTITEFGAIPLTAGLLAVFLPELSALPAATPLEVRIAPTIAPIMTGAPGPMGELLELKIAGLEVAIGEVGKGAFLVLEVDLDAGVDLTFTSAGLEFALATPDASGIDITITRNVYQSDEVTLVTTFQNLFPLFAPELANAIDAFPIPSLLGLDLQPIEVARLQGGYIGLFADFAQTPTTHLDNVVFTDLSSGDFRQQGGCWLREWRHRLSGQQLGNTVSANLRGMLGADAGCTTNDASSSATLAYRIDLDVVAAAGEQWSLAIDHAILGALNRISDGYNDGIGFRDGGGTATIGVPVMGSYSVAGGASGSFDFTTSVTSISDGIGGSSSSQNVEFSGTNGVVLNGTTSATIQLDFQVALDAYSNSNTAFPTANGDEMAIRLGKNDTIDNNFTAGGYPGMGSRNIADDGHHVSVELTSSPLP